jgi:aspartate kinase
MSSQLHVFKFGGASVKDAAAVRNVAHIIQHYQQGPLVVVISAMGKTTNALEMIHEKRFQGEDYAQPLQTILAFHTAIADDLLLTAANMQGFDQQWESLQTVLASPIAGSYDQEYDQIVSYGELLSTALVHGYLKASGIGSTWLDVRRLICTDARHRDARVDWELSSSRAAAIAQSMEPNSIFIVQGFIGSTAQGLTTTLGREGSDFTAAIMAFLFDAATVTIWKDVPGMLNADPKWFDNTVKLDSISFREAIELAYYGASVIHPKTIKPLQNKGIPLYIKSFIHPEEAGSIIQENTSSDHLVPSYIFKGNQDLVSFIPKDFSFIVEDNLREIFGTLSEIGIRVNLMENSAISFSICIDTDTYKRGLLFEAMRGHYAIRYNEGLTLITVRHWDDQTLAQLTAGRDVLLEQKSRQTVRMVVR